MASERSFDWAGDADDSLLVSPKASPARAATNPAKSGDDNNGDNSGDSSGEKSEPSSADDSFAAARATLATPAKRRRTFDYASALEQLEFLAPTPATACRRKEQEGDGTRDDAGQKERMGGDHPGPPFDAEEGHAASPLAEGTEPSPMEGPSRPRTVDPAAGGSPEVRELTPRQLAELPAEAASSSEGTDAPRWEASMDDASGPSPPEPFGKEEGTGSPSTAPTDGREATGGGHAEEEAVQSPGEPEGPTGAAATVGAAADATAGAKAEARTETGDSCSNDSAGVASATPASVFRRPCLRESNPEPPELDLQMGHPLTRSFNDDHAPLPNAHGGDDEERVPDADLSMEVAKAAEHGHAHRELPGEEQWADAPGAVPAAAAADDGAKATERPEDEAGGHGGLSGGQTSFLEEEGEVGKGNDEKPPRDSFDSLHTDDEPAFRPPLDGQSTALTNSHLGRASARKGARIRRRLGDRSAPDIGRDAGGAAPWDAPDSLDDGEDGYSDPDEGKPEYAETMRARIAGRFAGRSSAPAAGDAAGGEGDDAPASGAGRRIVAGDDAGRARGAPSGTHERCEGVLGELRGRRRNDAARTEGADACDSLERSEDDVPGMDELRRRREEELASSAAVAADEDAAGHDLNAAQESFSSDKGDKSEPAECKFLAGDHEAGEETNSTDDLQVNTKMNEPNELELQAKSFCDDVLETSIVGVASQFAAAAANEVGASLEKSSLPFDEALQPAVSQPSDLESPPLVDKEAQLFVAMPDDLSPIAKSTSPHESSDLLQSDQPRDAGTDCENTTDLEGQVGDAEETTATEGLEERGNEASDGDVAKKASIFQFLSEPNQGRSDGFVHDPSKENAPEEAPVDVHSLERDCSEDDSVKEEERHPDRSLEVQSEQPPMHEELGNEDGDNAASFGAMEPTNLPLEASPAADLLGTTPTPGNKRKSSLEDLTSYQQEFSSTSSAFLEQLRGAAEDRKREVTRARYSMERKEQMLYDERREMPLPAVEEESMEEEPSRMPSVARPSKTGIEGDAPYKPFKARPLPSTTTERPRRSSTAPARKNTSTQLKRKTLAPGENPYVPFKARPMPGASSSRMSSSLGAKRKSSTAFQPHPAENKSSSYVKDSALNAKPPKRLLSGEDASIAKEISRNQRLRKEEAKIRKDSIFKARPLPASTLPRSHGPLAGEDLVARKVKVGSGKENGSEAFVPRSSSRAEERAAYDAERAKREQQQLQDQMERRNELIERTSKEIKDLKRFIR